MKQRFCNGMIHVIKSGENLYQLSRKYHVPLALILRANPYVDVYNLQPGQEICIPMSRPMMPFPGVRPPMPRNVGTENMPGEMDMREMEEKEEQMSNMKKEKPTDYKEDMTDEMMMEQQEENKSFAYVTEEMESLASILDKTEMAVEELLANNDLDKIMLAPNVTLNVDK